MSGVVELCNEIKNVSGALLASNGRFTPHVVERVSESLVKRIQLKDSERLNQEDLKELKEELIIGDARSYQTWLHLDCFNQIIYKLKETDKIESPFFNTPQRIRRHLLFDIDEEVLADTRQIQLLRDALAILHVPSTADLREEEIECVCAFLASACIFGKIMLPNFHRVLQSLRFRDICMSPVNITIPVEDSDTFTRYFLPFPANLYFLRCLLFYKKNYRSDWVKRKKDPDAQLLKPVNFSEKELSRVFRDWMAIRLRTNGLDSVGLNVPSFRAAAKMASVIHPGDTPYPSFLLAVHSGKLKNYSLSNNHLGSILDEKLPASESMGANRVKKDLPSIVQEEILTNLLSEIRAVRRPLLKKERCKLKERVAAAEDIMNKVSSSREELTEDDYQNLESYAKWVGDLLKARRYTLKTVNDYASVTQNFLLLLSGKGALTKMHKDRISVILKLALDRCESRSVRTALKAFTLFLSSCFGKDFDLPNWKLQDLLKKDIPQPVTFIDFKLFRMAINESKTFFTKYPCRLKQSEKQENQYRLLVQKATAVSHIISLAFHAGLRVGEITNLRVGNVIFDGGVVLCIRASKTKNGIRNVPLSMLAPQSYVQEFQDFFYKRRAEAGADELLFVQGNGKPWDRSHVSSEAARLFEYIGLIGFKFHHLRHSFANWFLVRWFLVFHAGKVPADIPFLSEEIFDKNHLENIKSLVLGMNTKKIGQQTSTYGLAVLARLLGHGGPIVTIERYLHNLDWLFYMLSGSSDNGHIKLSLKQAESFLQLSYPSLPIIYKGRGQKIVSPRDLLNTQSSLLI